MMFPNFSTKNEVCNGDVDGTKEKWRLIKIQEDKSVFFLLCQNVLYYASSLGLFAVFDIMEKRAHTHSGGEVERYIWGKYTTSL